MHLRHTLSVFALATAAGSAHAGMMLVDISGGVALSEVVGNQFRVRDKLFTIQSFSSPPNQFDASQLTILPFVAGNPLAGIGFDITGAMQDFVRGDELISDFTLEYTVEIVDDPGTPDVDESEWFITDNTLSFNGTSGGEPGSLVRVNETVFNFETGELIGQKEVFDIVRESDGVQETQLQDMLEFDPIRKLQIVKDVELFAATDCCDATISFIRQSFSQIPTPGTATLLAGAGLGLTARRRR